MICLLRYLSSLQIHQFVPCIAITHQLCMQVLKSDSIYTARAVHIILHSISIMCLRASICPTRSDFGGVDIIEPPLQHLHTQWMKVLREGGGATNVGESQDPCGFQFSILVTSKSSTASTTSNNSFKLTRPSHIQAIVRTFSLLF